MPARNRRSGRPRDPARRVLRPGREELAVTDPVARRSASLRGASGEGSAGPEPKIATVERREASVSRETQGASQGVWRAALRHARGCPSTRAFSRRSATPHSGARSKESKTRAQKCAAGTKKHVLFDK